MYCRLICKSSQKYAFEVWKSYIHICIWMNAYIYTCQPYNSVHVLISCFSRMSNKKGIEYTMWSKWMFVWDSLIIIGGTFIKLHVFSARMIWTGQHLKTSYYILVYNVWPTSNRYFNVTRKCIRISNSSSDIISNFFSILTSSHWVSKKDKRNLLLTNIHIKSYYTTYL